MSEWIKHIDYSCPVPPKTFVEVEYSYGITREGFANQFNWGNAHADIVRYRVIEQPKLIDPSTPIVSKRPSVIPDEVKREQEKRGWDKFIGDSRPDREELRIRAAQAAMQGILSHEGVSPNPKDHVAWGLDYADAFIEELERRKSDDK